MKPAKKTIAAVSLSLVVTGVLFFLLATQLVVKLAGGQNALEPVLVVTVSGQKQNIFALYYDPDGKEPNWLIAETVSKPLGDMVGELILRFTLPDQEITRLRLDFGTQPDKIIIRRIAVITQKGNTCTWKGSDIVRFFPESSPDIGAVTIVGGDVHIETIGDAPQMISDPFEMENECDQLGTVISRQYTRWLVSGGLVFGLLAMIYFHFLGRNASVVDLSLISGFLLVLTIPLITQISGVGNTVINAENRALTTAPATPSSLSDIRRFPARWSAYFNDHFGGRTEMIFWSNQFKVRVLNTSPVQQVVLGKDNWLFYAGEDAMLDYQGLVELPQEDLQRLNRYIQEIKQGLAARGIKFLVVIAPDKQTVYPEYLPGNIKNVGLPTRADQFLEYNATHAQADVLDLRPVLVAKKDQAPLDIYYKTDTHWNRVGAFYAYQAIIDHIAQWFPQITPYELSDYQVTTASKPGTDLAKITMMRSYFMDTEVTLTPNFQSGVKRVALDYPLTLMREAYATEINDASLPKAVIFHDSFGPLFSAYLSEHFERLVYVWTYSVDWQVIDREQPDVVILQFLERRLNLITETEAE